MGRPRRTYAPREVGKDRHPLDPWGRTSPSGSTTAQMVWRSGRIRGVNMDRYRTKYRGLEGERGGLCPAVGHIRLKKKVNDSLASTYIIWSSMTKTVFNYFVSQSTCYVSILNMSFHTCAIKRKPVQLENNLYEVTVQRSPRVSGKIIFLKTVFFHLQFAGWPDRRDLFFLLMYGSTILCVRETLNFLYFTRVVSV